MQSSALTNLNRLANYLADTNYNNEYGAQYWKQKVTTKNRTVICQSMLQLLAKASDMKTKKSSAVAEMGD